MSLPRKFALGALLFLLPSAGAGQKSSPPETATIKVQAPSVLVDVLVTDRKGRHVGGLKASDFSIYEDDVPQTISTFVPPAASNAAHSTEETRVAQPPAPQPSGIAPGLSPASVSNIRFITLVLDLGDLEGESVDRAIRAAEQYLKTTVAPEDFVAVYWIDQSLHLAVPFTADKNAAASALKDIGQRALSGRFSTTARKETQEEIDRLTEQIYGLQAAGSIGMSDQVGGTTGGATGPVTGGTAAAAYEMGLRELATLRQFLWSQSTFQARAVFMALRAMAQSYASLPGRKNVVVFSQGFLHSPDAKPQLAAVIDSANRANVAFYIVDASGLNSLYDAQSDLPPDTGGMREAYLVGSWGPSQIMATGLDKFDWNEHMGLDNQYDDLGQVAAATGGLLIRNQNDLMNGLRMADSDLREFYTLVYQPTNKHYDGAFRHIRVALNVPGTHVRYREGYWAIPPGEELSVTPAAAQLLNAYRAGSLKSAVTPEINAAELLAPDGKFSIPVHLAIPTKALHFDKVGENYKAALSLVLAAEAPDGRLLSVHQRFLDLNLNKKQMDEFEKKALDINARLSMADLEPVRLVAIVQLTGGTMAIGREELPLEGDKAGGLRLTGLALSNDVEPALGTRDASDPLCGDNFQLFLPARSSFVPSDRLTALFGIIQEDNRSRPQEKSLMISYAIAKGGRQVETLPEEDLPVTRPRFVVLKQVELKGLTPGQYSFEIRVRNPVGGAEVSRSAPFVVLER